MRDAACPLSTRGGGGGDPPTRGNGADGRPTAGKRKSFKLFTSQTHPEYPSGPTLVTHFTGCNRGAGGEALSVSMLGRIEQGAGAQERAASSKTAHFVRGVQHSTCSQRPFSTPSRSIKVFFSAAGPRQRDATAL